MHIYPYEAAMGSNSRPTGGFAMCATLALSTKNMRDVRTQLVHALRGSQQQLKLAALQSSLSVVLQCDIVLYLHRDACWASS